MEAKNYDNFVMSPEKLKVFDDEKHWYSTIKDPKQAGPVQALKAGVDLLRKLELSGAFVKTTTGEINCGNTSVAQGVADEYFQSVASALKEDGKVKIVNCGSGGNKAYVYGYSLKDKITYLIEEIRDAEPVCSPHMSAWGTYKPKTGEISQDENEKRTLAQLKRAHADAITLVLITGPLRVHYYAASPRERNSLDLQMAYLFHNAMPYKNATFFMPQEEEGEYELKATRCMYSNLVKREWISQLQIVAHCGIGGSSSQFSYFEADGKISTITFGFGMNNQTEKRELEQFVEFVLAELAKTDFLQRAKAIKNAAIAMKSGTALLFEKDPGLLQMFSDLKV